MKRVIAPFILLLIVAVVAGAERSAPLQLEGDVYFLRERYGPELDVPPQAGVKSEPSSPRKIEVTFRKGGDVIIAIDGVETSYGDYSGVKTGGEDTRGLLNSYPVAALVGMSNVLKALVGENSAAFKSVQAEDGSTFDFYGMSPGSALTVKEEVSFMLGGERTTIRAYDLYGPPTSYFNRAMGIGKPFQPMELNVYFQLNGSMAMINEIAAAISAVYSRVSDRPTFRRLMVRN